MLDMAVSSISPTSHPALSLSSWITMSHNALPMPSISPRATQRSVWVAPEVRDLPRLTDLTLQTGGDIPGEGGTGGGGGTVVG
jgi:hypothetical protein